MSETVAKFPPKLSRLFEPHRYKFVKGGRGSAKSWGIARALLIQGAQETHRIACFREVQRSIRESVHQLLRDQIAGMNMGAYYDVFDHEIRGKSGSLFTFRGLSDLTADSIKSFEGYSRAWVEEAHTTTKASWQILRPTIRAPGSEIWASYNPELETDEVNVMATVNPPPDSITIEMNWQDNPWFPPELEAERLHDKATLKPEEYAHIWEGKCKPAVEGAIYFDEVSKAETEGRMTRVPHDPLLKSHAIWDLGWNDAMSIIIAQRVASEIRVIDYIEDSHRPITAYVEQLKLMPLNWGNDYLPHDGYAKRHQTGKSDAQVLELMERRPLMTPNIEVESGIRTARLVFPRIWFNTGSEGVKRLIECLKRYRRNVSASTGEPGSPRHDEYSHGADAFRYLSLVADQLQNNVRKPQTEHHALPAGWMA